MRLVLLSGPSGVGKGPLLAAVRRFFPQLGAEFLPIIKSRESRPTGPRPDEAGLWRNPRYFRDAAALRGGAFRERLAVADCKTLPQALDCAPLWRGGGGLFVAECYYTLASLLREGILPGGCRVTRVFLSPVGPGRIDAWRRAGGHPQEALARHMRRKLLARERFFGRTPNAAGAQDVAMRAADAWEELRQIPKYHWVLVNSCAEGSAAWRRRPNGEFAAPPTGAAGRTLAGFAGFLQTADVRGLSSGRRWAGILEP